MIPLLWLGANLLLEPHPPLERNYTFPLILAAALALLPTFSTQKRTGGLALPICPACAGVWKAFELKETALVILSRLSWAFLATGLLDPGEAWIAAAVSLAVVLAAEWWRADQIPTVVCSSRARVWFRSLHTSAIEACAERGEYLEGRWRSHACAVASGKRPSAIDDALDGMGSLPADFFEGPSDSPKRQLRRRYRPVEEWIRGLGLSLIAAATPIVLVCAIALLSGWVTLSLMSAGSPGRGSPRWGEIAEVCLPALSAATCIGFTGWKLYQLTQLGRFATTAILLTATLSFSHLHALPIAFVIAPALGAFLLWLHGPSYVFTREYRDALVYATPSMNRPNAVMASCCILMVGTFLVYGIALSVSVAEEARSIRLGSQRATSPYAPPAPSPAALPE